jgi:hypothetical protein
MGLKSHIIDLIKVVFQEPEYQIKNTNSQEIISKSTSFKTVLFQKASVTLSIFIFLLL